MRRGAVVLCLVAYSTFASAGVVESVDRIHNLIAGVSPNAEVRQAMITQLNNGDALGAALLATEHRAFYDRVLLDWVSPWTNEAQDRFAPLNDFSATVIGMIRDDKDFRTVLYEDILYVGTPEQITRLYPLANGASSPRNFLPNAVNSDYYRELAREPQGLKALLKEIKQSDLYPLKPEQTAGVMTSQASGLAFFKEGTNRTPNRFFQMNFLCMDMEQLSDVTRPTTYIRQDVDRTPGEKAESFLTECAGCHSGLDALAGAFAYYDRIPVSSQPVKNEPTYTLDRYERLHYNDAKVMNKFFVNHLNFPDGFVTEDDSWRNVWREGRNASLGWDESLPGQGKGAKSMGMELAHSYQFAHCQAQKAYELVCLKNQGANKRDIAIQKITEVFINSGYKMRHAIAAAAVQCVQVGE
jgi:hypothetical protein